MASAMGYARLMELSMTQRQAVTMKRSAAYKRATKAEKSRILDEMVSLTGWHRDYVRAALRDVVKIKPKAPRPGRSVVYGPEILKCLAVCWKLTRRPAGKRLAPILPTLVPTLRRDGDIEMSDEDAAVLMHMSASTIDRCLRAERVKLGARGISHTKPGTLLKSQIPIRTWAQWDEDTPGFVEIDLVGHEGGNSGGEFCFTLTVTDIATGWTINRSVKNKAAVWVCEAIDYAAKRFPFPILGIDSDNGSEFINGHLFAYCKANKITFTRSRASHSNDGAHVEQKNWTHVRQLVGYLRYDTPEELDLLNAIWELDARFTNYVLAQQKLLSKQRDGAKVTKKYDRAITPCQRAGAHSGISPGAIATMDAASAEIHPGQLYRTIESLTSKLQAVALAKTPTPPKPRVNQAFNS